MTGESCNTITGLLRTLGRWVIGAAMVFGIAPPVAGQAWVPPAKVGSVGILLQDVDHTGHFLADGSLLPGYESASRGALLRFDYAFTDRFSITAAVAYLGAKYIGPEPSFFGLEIDECRCWNTSWQDGSLTARYNVLNGSFALTPSITYGAPLVDYPYFGEAVVGRNLDELRLAIDMGGRLDAVSPKLSISGSYSYAFVEQVLDLNLDRSNLLASVGYLFVPRFHGSLDFYLQRTHGGLRSTEFETDEEWAQFDRILKDDSFHVGFTLVYSFDRFDLMASYIEFVDGTDTHDGRAVTVGVAWPFQL